MARLRLVSELRRATALFSFAAALALGALLPACGDAPTSPTPTGSMPSTPAATSIQTPGQMIFAQYCNVCHPGGGRGAGPSLKTIDDTADEIRSVIRNGKARMPSYSPKLISDQDLEALVQYVISLRQ